jgi:rubrerythrin
MKLTLGSDLTLPLDSVTQTFGLLAVRGAGKTNAARVMAEEMFAARLPFVAIDPVGSWYGLRSSADGRGPGLAIPIFGGKHGDVPLERAGGELVADLVTGKRLTCILDLSRFESESDKKAFLLAFARRLYLKNEDPLHLFLEEADDYIPQKPMRDEAQLLRAFENIVRRGRARGLGITLITQRSAAINKMVLTQVETLIAMRTTSPQDRAAIEAWVKYHAQSEEIVESLAGLDNGEAWVWSPHFLKTTKRVRFRLARTFDSGATPKNVREKDNRPAATLADVDLQAIQAQMAATIEKAKAEDPRELRKQIAELKRQLTQGTHQMRGEVGCPNCGHVPDTFLLPQRCPKCGIGVLKWWAEKGQPKPAEKPVLTDADRELLQKFAERLAALRESLTVGSQSVADEMSTAIMAAMNRYVLDRIETFEEMRRAFEQRLESKGLQKILDKLAAVATAPPPRHTPTRGSGGTTPARAVVARRPVAPVRLSSAEGVKPAPQKILNGLAFLHGIGVAQADKTQLALLIGVSPTSGGYFNNLGALRSSGLIDYPTGGTVALTDAGASTASTNGVPTTTNELHDAIRAKLQPAKWKILEALIAIYPKSIAKAALAERIEVSPTSGGYFNNLGSLRSLGLIGYPRPSEVVALPVLFLEERGKIR